MMTDPLYDGPINDYEDQAEAVRLGILDYDDTHCEHGTFVGGWAGPDYMCHWCEQGISAAELDEMRREHEKLAKRWAKVRNRQLELCKRYNGEPKGTPMFDSLVRATTWLMKRSHWQ